MKMKKLLAVICVSSIALSFAGCMKGTDKNNDETVESTKAVEEGLKINITIDGKAHEMSEGDIIYSDHYRDFRDFNGEKFDYIEINGIKIGSDISELDAFLVPGYTNLNYEYDPYGDGCTDVNSEIYEGTLPDFDEDVVLDMFVENTYVMENGQWKQIKFDADADYGDQLLLFVQFDLYGHAYDEDMYEKVGTIYTSYCYSNSSLDSSFD